MNETLIRNLTKFILALSVFVTFWSMGRSADWSFEIGSVPFALWAVSPYLFLFSAQLLSERIPAIPKIPSIFCILSIVMLGFTIFAYTIALNGESSTEALVYIFVPIYLYTGSIIVLFISFIVAFFINRSRRQKA